MAVLKPEITTSRSACFPVTPRAGSPMEAGSGQMAYPLTVLLAYHFVIMSVPWITKSEVLLNSLRLSVEVWRSGMMETTRMSALRNRGTIVGASQWPAVRYRNKERVSNCAKRNKGFLWRIETPADIMMCCPLKMIDIRPSMNLMTLFLILSLVKLDMQWKTRQDCFFYKVISKAQKVETHFDVQAWGLSFF